MLVLGCLVSRVASNSGANPCKVPHTWQNSAIVFSSENRTSAKLRKDSWRRVRDSTRAVAAAQRFRDGYTRLTPSEIRREDALELVEGERHDRAGAG